MSGNKHAVRRIRRGDRGLLDYGQPMKCSYGVTATVRTSSSAMGWYVWLFVDEVGSTLTRHEPGKASMHLGIGDAQKLINRLQAWLDDVNRGRRRAYKGKLTR